MRERGGVRRGRQRGPVGTRWQGRPAGEAPSPAPGAAGPERQQPSFRGPGCRGHPAVSPAGRNAAGPGERCTQPRSLAREARGAPHRLADAWKWALARTASGAPRVGKPRSHAPRARVPACAGLTFGETWGDFGADFFFFFLWLLFYVAIRLPSGVTAPRPKPPAAAGGKRPEEEVAAPAAARPAGRADGLPRPWERAASPRGAGRGAVREGGAPRTHRLRRGSRGAQTGAQREAKAEKAEGKEKGAESGGGRGEPEMPKPVSSREKGPRRGGGPAVGRGQGRPRRRCAGAHGAAPRRGGGRRGTVGGCAPRAGRRGARGGRRRQGAACILMRGPGRFRQGAEGSKMAAL